jgi:hypothetical protein
LSAVEQSARAFLIEKSFNPRVRFDVSILKFIHRARHDVCGVSKLSAVSLSERFFSSQEGSASRNFFLSALWWSLWGMGAGLLGGLEFSNPDLVHNVPQLAFPHLRMFHVNAVAIGWLSMGFHVPHGAITLQNQIVE